MSINKLYPLIVLSIILFNTDIVRASLIIFKDQTIAPETKEQISNELEKIVQTFGVKPKNPIVIDDSANCLRTGYRFIGKSIVFCSNKDVINKGLESIDVIRHELFHAYLCDINPHLCPNDLDQYPELVIIHEALADWYTSTLDITNHFGENFKHSVPYLRTYKNNLCYSLVDNIYAKANSITSEIIKLEIDSKSILEIMMKKELSYLDFNLKNNCFGKDAPVIDFIPANSKISKLNRYSVKASENIIFSQKSSNIDFYNLTVEIDKPGIFEYKIDNNNNLIFTPISNSGFSKINILIFDINKLLIGNKILYLQIKN